MTTQTTVVEEGPFHETIVDAIKTASNLELQGLGELIKRTGVPKNHDAIIVAWTERGFKLGWDREDGADVLTSLSQKKVAAEAPKTKIPANVVL